jgi:mannitol-1-phosphate/altronate dehydrogenase
MSNIVRFRPSTALPLNNATLALHSTHLEVPTYDRSALTPAIVHIGVGGFHRAHQAHYLEELANRGISQDWGVTGVGLRRRAMKSALSQQDYLYTVVERGAGHESARVIGCMPRYLYAREEHQRVLAALTDERTRIVSLTITGDGYHPDDTAGLWFDTAARQIPVSHSPEDHFPSAWAYLVEALDQRRRAGKPPFTVMSCDNLPDNGRAAREALVSSAALRSDALASWISDNVAFPSTMVDRITPKTEPSDRDAVARSFMVADQWPVITEPFTQWVIEDQFCTGRPPLEEVGAELVGDVSAHKLVKSRLLNGSHCALGYLGLLAGYQQTDQAMRDPVLYSYVEHLMRDEIAPLLPSVPGLDVEEYQKTLLGRLSNPRITDQLSRLTARGSTKMPAYLLPSLAEARARRRPSTLLSVAVVAWMRYLRGYDFKGRPLEVVDPRATELTTMAKTALHNPVPLLRIREVFGDLSDDGELVGSLGEMSRDLDRLGLPALLHRVMSRPEMTATG